MIRKISAILLLVIIVGFVIPAPASAAYIDPNTGGMLFSLLAVIFGALSAMILLLSGKIKMFFSRTKRRLRGSSDDELDEETTNGDYE
jgi:hypothetical protein